MDRYNIDPYYDGLDINKDPKGEWIKYSDVKSEIAELKQSLAASQTDLTNQAIYCDEISAHIKRLGDAAFAFKKGLAHVDNGVDLGDELCKVYNETNAQSLAKHDVEVIRKMLDTLEDDFDSRVENVIYDYLDKLEQEGK